MLLMGLMLVLVALVQVQEARGVETRPIFHRRRAGLCESGDAACEEVFKVTASSCDVRRTAEGEASGDDGSDSRPTRQRWISRAIHSVSGAGEPGRQALLLLLLLLLGVARRMSRSWGNLRPSPLLPSRPPLRLPKEAHILGGSRRFRA